MILLAYYFFVGLLSRINGQAQPSLTLSDAYVDRFMPVIITCQTGPIGGSVDIFRNGTSVYRCNLPSLPCDNLFNVTEYSVVQNASAGTTIMTISASDISRDTGTWTCQYGASPMSEAKSLSVGTPLNIANMTEGPEAVVIQTSCTFPAVIVNVTCSLNGTSLSYTFSVSSNGSTCTDHNEAALTVIISLYPTQSVKGPGFLTVSVFNGIHRSFRTGTRVYTFLSVTTTTTTSTKTTTTTTVTSSSTSISSATSSLTLDTTSTNPTTNGSAASATSSTSTSMNPISVSPANNTNNTSTSAKPTVSESTTINNTTNKKSKSIISNTDIKVIVPAVVVPCGLLIIGGIILVVCCERHRARKNVRESPDGMAVQDKGNNIEGWKQSQRHGKATDNLDGFVIYPSPAAMSNARSYKKHHDGTDQYNRPYAGLYHHQSEYFSSKYTSARANYTHKDKKHHGVTDQYSRPYTGTYGYQAGYVPSTYKSARTYPHKGRNYYYEGPIHQQGSHQMATSRPAYDQTTYYPQTGYYGQSSQDVFYSGGGQYSYGQRSMSHHDHSGRKQQREYNNQYEMADYGGSRVGHRHKKQDTSFFY